MENTSEIKDSFGNKIKRGYIAFSLIGFSGSGCTQHLRAAKVAFNGVSYTLKTQVKCPGHSYDRGCPVRKLIEGGKASGACFSRMLTEKQFNKFPHGKTALIFHKDDFKKICQTGGK